MREFQARHGIEGMVVVADAGMLSAGNLRELDEAGLRVLLSEGPEAAHAQRRPADGPNG